MSSSPLSRSICRPVSPASARLRVWPYLLDGDNLAGIFVDGLVDNAKGAVADLLEQLVFRRRIHAVLAEWLRVP
jgi:hypothetical protein